MRLIAILSAIFAAFISICYADENHGECSVTFFENMEVSTDQIPWGITAGEIVLENGQTALLLTPGTSFQLQLPAEQSLSLEYCIHPWVSGVSNGVIARVCAKDQNNENIITCELGITEEVQHFVPPENSMALYVEVLHEDDESGDWAIFTVQKQQIVETKTSGESAGFPILPAAWVNAKTKFFSIEHFSDEVVLGRGETWDCEDVLNPSVIFYRGQWLNYYSGWDGSIWRTGLAISQDGQNWEKQEQPLLDIREDEWDNSYIAANGSAVVYQDKVYYYYHGRNAQAGRSEIGLAISEDGFLFDERTDAPVLCSGTEGTWDCNGVADPYVIEFGGKLYMYYLGMDEVNVQRLGVAVSVDGYIWTKYANNPIMDVGVMGAFDENGLGEPSVVYYSPYFYMLYTGRNNQEQRNIGVAVSRDGVHWKKLCYQGVIELSSNTWDNQVICDTTLWPNDDGTFSVWYGGGNEAEPAQNLNGKIGSFTISFAGAGAIKQFNADTWNDDEIPSTEILAGSYPLEGETGSKTAWVSELVGVVLQNAPEADMITISGYLPMNLFNQVGIDQVSIYAYINGIKVGSYTTDESGSFQIHISKEAVDSDYLLLEIFTSEYVNPKEEGIGVDERNLCWILNSILQYNLDGSIGVNE